MVCTIVALLALGSAPVVLIDRDDVEITTDCVIEVVDRPIADAGGDGIVRITADGVTVVFADGAVLRGAPADAAADGLTGTGIRITGHDVTVRGARVAGYKVGVHAVGADGLTIDGADLSGNFRQRLKSTPQAEDAADWLWPHHNDNHEWITRYGAALCVERCRGATVRGVRVRDGQNGILLDRVERSRVYDNDCSFISGWGLAMWRSSDNVVSRNAFDFCIRGYSHGVYNRGQDSAGILLFEQCSRNLIVENSATHGGDGLFGFAGKEALGEVDPRDDLAWYRRRGNADNLIAGNDFSDAAAHGIEMTFSFGNRILDNRLVGNGICGVWGGYSQQTLIAGNTIEGNGECGYGLERGGINIEHGRDNRIEHNVFDNGWPAGDADAHTYDIHLWWDDDGALLATPWARANDPRCDGNVVDANAFGGAYDERTPAILLRTTGGTTRIRRGADGGPPVLADEKSPVAWLDPPPSPPPPPPEYEPLGSTTPVGARAHLRGRHRIVMDAWGPVEPTAP